MLAEPDHAPGEREIAILTAEHRACVMRAGELRADVLRRIDDALGAARADTPPQVPSPSVRIPTLEAAEAETLRAYSLKVTGKNLSPRVP
jgi:hypothetical protein